jgi:hypothetical protein
MTLRTSKPVMSQYRRCGSTDGGDSIDRSAPLSQQKVASGARSIMPPTRRYILFHYRANRSSPVNLHRLLTLGPPFFPLQPFALTLLTENSLQVFRPAARILRISRVLEWTRGRQDGQLLRKSLVLLPRAFRGAINKWHAQGFGAWQCLPYSVQQRASSE